MRTVSRVARPAFLHALGDPTAGAVTGVGDYAIFPPSPLRRTASSARAEAATLGGEVAELPASQVAVCCWQLDGEVRSCALKTHQGDPVLLGGDRDGALLPLLVNRRRDGDVDVAYFDELGHHLEVGIAQRFEA